MNPPFSCWQWPHSSSLVLHKVWVRFSGTWDSDFNHIHPPGSFHLVHFIHPSRLCSMMHLKQRAPSLSSLDLAISDATFHLSSSPRHSPRPWGEETPPHSGLLLPLNYCLGGAGEARLPGFQEAALLFDWVLVAELEAFPKSSFLWILPTSGRASKKTHQEGGFGLML